MGEAIIDTSDTGNLGLLHLKRYWSDTLRLRDGKSSSRNPKEENLTKILLHDLGIGFNEPNQFILEQRPTYEEFEHWIINRLGEHALPRAIARTNERISRFLEDGHRQNSYPLATAIKEPVFSEQEMNFWKNNGYIVLKQAISREDAKATEAAIWEFSGQNPENRDSWDKGEHNFWLPMYQHPTLTKNRQSKRIHKAFAQLWGTENLICEINRVSMNFPCRTNDTYRSGPSNLHWDISLAQPMPFDLLGLIYLTDTEEKQGAFRCIPGFHHRIESWLQHLPEGRDPREEILKESAAAVAVAGSAGDLVICRQELAHGSSPNRGSYPRICQYLSMFPPDYTVHPVWK